VERQGVRVAVIGYATANTPNTLATATTAPYDFRAGVQGIQDALEAVKRHAPDFTIIVAHAGGGCADDGCRGEMVDLAQALEPGSVQMIAGGHDHSAGHGVVNGIPIVRSSSHARAMSVVDLVRHADGRRGFSVARDTIYVDRVQPDRAMQALIAPYVARAESMARTPIAVLRDSLSVLRSPALGNIIADATLAATGADLAMHNPGGVRADLHAGLVTYNDAFRVLPFGNTVVKVTLTGVQLREVVERALPRYYFAGARLVHDPARPAGERLVSLTFDDGRTLDDAATYTFGTVDFLAAGGDGFTMLTPLPTEHTGRSLLDVFIEHLRAQPQPAVAPAEPRVVPVR
jgi:2',3'-cyclic-nucleotide 2'-phosphodiesterase (5'-nucleotidase family)